MQNGLMPWEPLEDPLFVDFFLSNDLTQSWQPNSEIGTQQFNSQALGDDLQGFPSVPLGRDGVAVGSSSSAEPEMHSNSSNDNSKHNNPEHPHKYETELDRLMTKDMKLRDKNKRAQKKFREKQKAKAKEVETRLELLEAQVKSLNMEKNNLEVRNSILEKAVILRDSHAAQVLGPHMAGVNNQEPQELYNCCDGRFKDEEGSESSGHSGRCSVDDVTSGAVDRKAEGLDDFASRNVVVLETGGGEAETYTAARLKEMTTKEHADLWKRYVKCLADCLLEANGNPKSPAGTRLMLFVKQLHILGSIHAAKNPGGFMSKYAAINPITQHNMRPGDVEPSRERYLEILALLAFSEEERQEMMMKRRVYLTSLGKLLAERDRINDELQSGFIREADTRLLAARHQVAIAASEKLAANLKSEQIGFHQFMTWLKSSFTPFQAAIMITQCYPFPTDMLAMMNILAQQMGEPGANELLAQGAA